MNELSLFTGAGGGVYGSLLLGHRLVGYVEMDKYCCDVISQRVEDGIFDDAPIYNCKVRDWLDAGFVEPYIDNVDILSGGFPCQPFSTAGKRKGADDERNGWPETADALRTIRPRIGFFENVPGLLNSGYFPTILADIHKAGYHVAWKCLSAAECGAWQVRNRLWILAFPDSGRFDNPDVSGGTREEISVPSRVHKGEITGVNSRGLEKQREIDRPGNQTAHRNRKTNQSRHDDWWANEPGMGRMVHGLADRVHRIKALGNGQVPIVAARVFGELMDMACKWDNVNINEPSRNA